MYKPPFIYLYSANLLLLFFIYTKQFFIIKKYYNFAISNRHMEPRGWGQMAEDIFIERLSGAHSWLYRT